MDLHPTPFPGKRRPSANSIRKDGGRIKPSKQPGPPAEVTAQTRPKRAFGVVRSTNISIDKPGSRPPSTKKPSATSVNPGRRGAPTPAVAIGAKAPESISGSGSGKAKADSKKNHRVGFHEPPMVATASEGTERGGKGDGPRTPLSLIKPAALGTPYLSAQNCSKCRIDRLESSSYWLVQIKLAESAGKHFASAAFFRLALDCNAQPFLGLQRELKHYVARHGPISSDGLWGNLHAAYGLSEERSIANPKKADAVLVEQESFEPNNPDEEICKRLGNGCLESDVTDAPHKDSSSAEEPIGQEIDDSIDKWKEDLGIKESVEVNTTPPFKTSSLKHHPSGSVAIAHGGGKISDHEKSKLDSSSKTKARAAGGSADKGGETSDQPRTGSKISGGKLTRRNGAGPSPNNEQRNVEADGKGPILRLSEKLSPGESSGDPIINQDS